ncbi:NAD(P)H-binding protein [Facklamia sp. DSM 111018]|uniref:NAD(P)H-binding protein n=1 Tax=Facklamia lactis TaxID=2749967 RepID=A0ABS0LPX9_9LACT|nr:NAD(P)H-binding protein [Facklamia lactis]MBG9986208.1 NAD(P)H-binding protein [Facklamia lactis]
MKIGIIGATGRSGSLILEETIRNSHDVVAIIRDAKKLRRNDIPFIEVDALNLTAKVLQDFNVIIHAFGSWGKNVHLHKEVMEHLLKIINDTTRLLVVGGAGALFVNKKKQIKLKDTSDYPSHLLPVANAGNDVLTILKSSDYNLWTYVSPVEHFIFEGDRTGNYVTGTDELPVLNYGTSEISYADFAIAILDEAKNRNYIGKHISVYSLEKYTI